MIKKSKSHLKIETILFLVIMIFGCLSIFITYPLSNGDEGYHLSICYNIFSSSHPEVMSEEVLRGYEMQAISGDSSANKLNIGEFNKKKLDDVQNDGFKLNYVSNNSILKIDIMHIPSALGVLIARIIYPSYGFMLFFARLFNLIFFSISTFFIMKHSEIGKWTLFMMFTIPCLQKMASPSYDVFSYVAFFTYIINLFELAKLKSVKFLSSKRILYTLFTIILLLFAKSNYVFALTGIMFLPMITTPILRYLRNLNKSKKLLLAMIFFVLSVVLIIFLNEIFDLKNFIRLFFNNYINMSTAGRRGKELFNIVPTILPNIFNILWCVILVIVIFAENMYKWDTIFNFGSILVFFINWIGIYAGFYLILGHPNDAFDELSGRYLHPYILFLLPTIQSFGNKYNIKIPEKTIKKIVFCITIFIMIMYLIIVYYRGYIINVTPTWNM